MKTKKCGAYAALAAVLLISAALITSCPESFNPGGLTVPQVQEQTPFVPPEGMGYVILNFGDGPGRTIRPPTSTFTGASSFNFFDVHFVDTDYDPGETDTDAPSFTNKSVDRLNIISTNIGNAIVVPAGNYEVHVYAYLTASGGTSGTKTTAAAYGADMSTVISGTGDTVPIVLHETGAAGSGNGKFALNLTQPSTNAATTMSMVITPLSSGTPNAAVPLNTALLTTYTADLAAGYYRVEITLSRNYVTGVVMSTTIRDILHIYQGMTSTYARQLPPVNTDRYTVTYTLHDGSTPGTENEYVKHGNTIAGPPIAGAVPTRTGYAFTGWFTTESGAPNTEMVVGTYMPLANDLLHARWTSTGVVISITVEMDDDESPQLIIATTGSTTGFTLTGSGDSYTVSVVDKSDPPTLVIAVDNEGDYDANSFVWVLNSAPTLFSSEDGGSVTMDFSDINLQLPGYHELTVDATISGTHYLSRIGFTVE
jgi:uncharacterized repeat protein (TIGR02543 family)